MRPGTLWIVATPIGTLADLSPRARDVLAEVDLVLAEDTRRARALFSNQGLPSRGRLRSLHEHNEDRQVPALVEALREGGSIALISDAGTPVLSDPVPHYIPLFHYRDSGQNHHPHHVFLNKG